MTFPHHIFNTKPIKLGQRLSLAAFAAMVLAGPVSAKQQTLEIIRDSGGSVVQSIPIETWSFDAANNVLSVKTISGNRLCANAPRGQSSEFTMNLDGRLYALEQINRSKIKKGRLIVKPVREGVFPICLQSASAIADQVFGKGTGALQLNLDLVQGNSIVRQDTAISGDIALTFGPTAYEMTGTDKLLCLEAAGVGAGVGLNFTDINAELETLRGISGISFNPVSNRFSATTSSSLVCVEPAQSPELTLDQIPSVASVCEPDTIPSNPDIVFIDGFETSVPVPGTSLGLDLVLTQEPSIDDNDPLGYQLVITNCQQTTVNNLLVRDFFPGDGGSQIPRLAQRDASGPVPELSNWSCGIGTNCVTSGGESYVNTIISSLAGESQAIINVTRSLDSNGMGSAGQAVLIDAALSATPGLSVPDNAVKSWNAIVQQSGNVAPELIPSVATIPTVDVDEDTVNALITDVSTFTLRVRDVDTALSNTFVFTTENDTLIPDENISAVFVQDSVPEAGFVDSGTITVRLTPGANQNGLNDISVAILDAGGRFSAPLDIPIDVIAVNDPPSFRLAEGFDDLDLGISFVRIEAANGNYCDLTRSGPAANYTLAIPGCVDNVWAPNVPPADLELVFIDWLDGFSGGPADEPQALGSVNFTVTQDPRNIIAIAPVLNSNAMNYTLSGNSGTATIAFTATDTEGASTTISFNVVVSNSRPVIVPVSAISIPENTGGSVVTLNANDDENDPISNWGIIGGNTSVDGDSDRPFAINPASGEITVNDIGDLDFEGPVPTFNLSVQVSDGNSFSDPVTVTINMSNVNDAPELTVGPVQLNVNDGSNVTISNSNLAANDQDNTASEIRYVVTTAPQNGAVRLSGSDLGINDFFTQSDIDSGFVTYANTSSGTFDGISMRLENADGTSNGQIFTLFISITPP